MQPLQILFVTPYLPSPPEFGGARRLHGLMEGLARRHEVSVISLVNPHIDSGASVEATSAYCTHVETIPHAPLGTSGRDKRLRQLRSLASPHSFEWLSYVEPRMQAALQQIFDSRPWDVVNFEFSHIAPYRAGLRLDAAKKRPVFVLDEHNIEFEILRLTAERETSVRRRVYNAVNWRKLHREEVRAWGLFDGCTVTSEADAALLRRHRPETPTAVVPNAVDLDEFRAQGVPVEPDTVLFFGAINYFPNTDGLNYFLQEILPELRKRRPGVKLRVVGHAPDAILELAGPGIEITNFVPDVRAEIDRAAVVIVPLRIGGGTRLKIVEAMAMGKAIVSTTLGAQGIDVVHGRDALVADEPSAFAAEVARALEDPVLARKLGAAARTLAEERYSWPAAVRTLEQFYASLADRPS